MINSVNIMLNVDMIVEIKEGLYGERTLKIATPKSMCNKNKINSAYFWIDEGKIKSTNSNKKHTVLNSDIKLTYYFMFKPVGLVDVYYQDSLQNNNSIKVDVVGLTKYAPYSKYSHAHKLASSNEKHRSYAEAKRTQLENINKSNKTPEKKYITNPNNPNELIRNPEYMRSFEERRKFYKKRAANSPAIKRVKHIMDKQAPFKPKDQWSDSFSAFDRAMADDRK